MDQSRYGDKRMWQHSQCNNSESNEHTTTTNEQSATNEFILSSV
jgi:hypothetical protein